MQLRLAGVGCRLRRPWAAPGASIALRRQLTSLSLVHYPIDADSVALVGPDLQSNINTVVLAAARNCMGKLEHEDVRTDGASFADSSVNELAFHT